MGIWKLIVGLAVLSAALSCSTPAQPARLHTSTNEIVTIEDLWPEAKLMGMPVQTLCDSRYRTITEAEVVTYFSPPTTPWQFDRNDCDDDALSAHVEALRRHRARDTRLVGLAVGIIAYTQADQAHMANVIRFRDGSWRVLDTRTMRLSGIPPRDKVLSFLF